jgi:hypothetical protein
MKKPRANYDIQGELIDYLNVGIDPYDFFVPYIDRFAEEMEIPNLSSEDDPSEVPENLIKKFTEWIERNNIHIDWVEKDPYGSPAYLTLSDAKRMPKGQWLIHFSEKEFRKFEYGSTVEGLHLTTYSKRKVRADCSNNLSDRIGLYETVWGFAYDADMSWSRLSGRTHAYGKHVVLFQCDYAIDAYHSGDEERQAIFPLCSEYNVIPVLYSDEYGALFARTFGDEELEFKEHHDVIRYFLTKHRPAEMLAGVQRGVGR